MWGDRTEDDKDQKEPDCEESCHSQARLGGKRVEAETNFCFPIVNLAAAGEKVDRWVGWKIRGRKTW